MKRRDFLWTMGAAAMMSPAVGAKQSGSAATVLYDGRAIRLNRVGPDTSGDALWIVKSNLASINGFELKPQGACREDICIPVPRATAGSSFSGCR